MSGLLSGLSSLGLGDLENAKIFEEPEKKEPVEIRKEAKVIPEFQEKDYIFDRSFDCPICAKKITSKVMKTGKSKLLRMDKDLRPVHEGVDTQKYEVVACTECGFAALIRYFQPMSSNQTKLIREKISDNVRMRKYAGDIYTYEEAMERYKLALVCAIVKQGKVSERAYICLKASWLLRGWQENLAGQKDKEEEIARLKEEEREYRLNALEGFVAAVGKEDFPMCGMEMSTVSYLIAALALEFGKTDLASQQISSILTSKTAGARIKEKARDLKDELLAQAKKDK
ncbi:MAG: DUF2225 domain-containing protein [Lachnospiraceae bacterium]|nr:DUF2225 domain-containing protein [Lachnospiraceae bacterium]